MEVQKEMINNACELPRKIKQKVLTFVVTEKCNLACKYCYMVGKNSDSVMTFDVAKKAIDYILEFYKDNTDRFIVEFIGGEPFLEVDLMDQVCDYFKKQLYIRELPWFENYGISITTNGLLYDNPKVQRFIKKNLNKLELTISIDGIKEKHDMQRIKPNGTGSYDDVAKNIPLWLKQFPKAVTKVTFASDDLPYLKDSIIHLWNMGIKDVPANVVYEDVWKQGDASILEEQLKELADYIIDNKLSADYKCGFFTDNIGYPIDKFGKVNNWCASGTTMLAVDYKGNFYPCIRFMKYSLEEKNPYQIGDINSGIDTNLLRPFQSLDVPSQSSDKCNECEVAKGCGWCQGLNYDSAEIETIFNRVTHICDMHKARCRANSYYYTKLESIRNISVKRIFNKSRFLYFLLADDSISYCSYNGSTNKNNYMSLEAFKAGIIYALQNQYTPILIHNDTMLPYAYEKEIEGVEVLHICPSDSPYTMKQRAITVFDNKVNNDKKSRNCVLKIDRQNIKSIPSFVESLIQEVDRINIIINDIPSLKDEDLRIYGQALDKVRDIIMQYIKNGKIKQISTITDILSLDEMQNCNAGVKTFAYCPDGNFYICPAFYYEGERNSIGNISSGINVKQQSLLKIDKAPVCSACDAYHCRRCIYQNKMGTREYNTPTAMQCRVSHLERENSLRLQRELLLNKENIDSNIIKAFCYNTLKEIEYDDPLDMLISLKEK